MENIPWKSEQVNSENIKKYAISVKKTQKTQNI